MPYYLVPNIPHLVKRADEEEWLRDCDDSCGNGRANCKCVLDLGTEVAGKRTPHHHLCVLCLRAAVGCGKMDNPYVNFDHEYERESLLSEPIERLRGAFVLYQASDYVKTGPRAIEQKLIPPQPSTINPLRVTRTYANWIDDLFVTYDTADLDSHFTEDIISNNDQMRDWCVCICQNPKCQAPGMLSYKDHDREVGIHHAYLDILEGAVVCMSCEQPVSYLTANRETNTVDLRHINEGLVSRCTFCTSVIAFDPRCTFQMCRNCTEDLSSQYEIAKKVCHYCHAPICIGKRSGRGFETHHLDTRPENDANDDEANSIYLCKKHRLKYYIEDGNGRENAGKGFPKRRRSSISKN